jgi:hypothetical protein
MRGITVVGCLLMAGCNVDMAPHMLQGSLFAELRKPEVISALCANPVPEVEVKRATPTELKVDQIAARRELFGTQGHGTAHVVFRPEKAPPCAGTVAFDFTQDSRVTRTTRRSTHTTSTFSYANVSVKR